MRTCPLVLSEKQQNELDRRWKQVVPASLHLPDAWRQEAQREALAPYATLPLHYITDNWPRILATVEEISRRQVADVQQILQLDPRGPDPGGKPQVQVPRKTESTGKQHKRQATRERLLGLVSFVAERVLPFGRLCREDLHPGRLGGKSVWPALHAAWNEARGPREYVNTWRAFKSAFYDAIGTADAPTPLAREFFLHLRHTVDGVWQDLVQQRVCLVSDVGQLFAPDPPPQWTFHFPPPPGLALHQVHRGMWWAGEMKEEEDALASPELVRRRVEAIFWRAVLGDPMADLRDQPLRVWWRTQVPQPPGE